MNLVRTLKALSDETRLRIIKVLGKGSLTVNEILFIIGGNQSNISHHLKILLEAGLVDSKKEGSWIYYKLSSLYDQIKSGWFEHEIANECFNSFDDKKTELVYEKRKSIAEQYFDSISESEKKKLFDFMENIFSAEEIEKFIDGRFDIILDVGCGNGRNLPILAKYASKVIGVDSSVKMVHMAEHLCKKCGIDYTLEIADIYDLPLANGSVDAAFVNMVLHHLPEPDRALVEVARVVRPSGMLFFVDFLEHNDEVMRSEHADLWLGFSDSDIKRWIESAGMKIVQKRIKEHEGYSLIIIKAQKPV